VKFDFLLCLYYHSRSVLSFRCLHKGCAGRVGPNLEFDLEISKQIRYLMPLLNKTCARGGTAWFPTMHRFHGNTWSNLEKRQGVVALCRLFSHLKGSCQVDEPCRSLVFHFQQLFCLSLSTEKGQQSPKGSVVIERWANPWEISCPTLCSLTKQRYVPARTLAWSGFPPCREMAHSFLK